ELFLGGFDRAALGDALGDHVAEAAEVPSGGLVAAAGSTVGVVGGRAGTPHLVGEADVVARSLEQEGPGRDAAIPDRAEEDGAEAGLPEVAAGEEGRPAGRARGRGDEGVA